MGDTRRMRCWGGAGLLTAALPAGLAVFWVICETGACTYGRNVAGPGLAAGGVTAAALLAGGLLMRGDRGFSRAAGKVVLALALPAGAAVGFVAQKILCRLSCSGDYLVLAMGAAAAGILTAFALLAFGGVLLWAGRRSPAPPR